MHQSKIDIALMYERHDEVSEANKQLSQFFNHYKAIEWDSADMALLEQHKPTVLLLAFHTTQKAIEVYQAALTEKTIDFPHKVILLIEKTCAPLAFDSCLNGMFDDFVVFRPLYEPYSLYLAVYRALEATLDRKHLDDIEIANERNSETLKSGFKLAVNIKKRLQKSINDSRNQISNTASSSEANQLEQINALFKALESSVVKDVDALIELLRTDSITAKAKDSQNADEFSNKPHQSDEADNGEKTVHYNDFLRRQAEKGKEPSREFEGKTALIAEDNSVFRKVLLKALTKAGFTVKTASDGAVACELVEKNKFDVALLDLFMPRMNGIQSTQIMRQTDNGKDLPIIALTGNKNKSIAKQWIKLGINEYLIKPTTNDKLFEALRNVIK